VPGPPDHAPSSTEILREQQTTFDKIAHMFYNQGMNNDNWPYSAVLPNQRTRLPDHKPILSLPQEPNPPAIKSMLNPAEKNQHRTILFSGIM
jgi:hypothetical protein